MWGRRKGGRGGRVQFLNSKRANIFTASEAINDIQEIGSRRRSLERENVLDKRRMNKEGKDK